jgi:hypothetical protein
VTQPAPNLKNIETKNQQNLKALPDSGTIDFLYAGLQVGAKLEYVLLIGAGHEPKILNRVKQAGPIKGKIDIGKGGLFGAGELKVSGCTDGRDQFKKIIGHFSKKKVTFR